MIGPSTYVFGRGRRSYLGMRGMYIMLAFLLYYFEIEPATEEEDKVMCFHECQGAIGGGWRRRKQSSGGPSGPGSTGVQEMGTVRDKLYSLVGHLQGDDETEKTDDCEEMGNVGDKVYDRVGHLHLHLLGDNETEKTDDCEEMGNVGDNVYDRVGCVHLLFWVTTRRRRRTA
jgi:hypothetical protein